MLSPYCSAGTEPQAVYSVEPQADGTLHVTLGAGSGTLFAYGPGAGACGDPKATIACEPGGDAGIYFGVHKNSQYMVVVQTTDTRYPPTFELATTPQCGNGVIEVDADAGEQCDFKKPDAAADGCQNCKVVPPSDDDAGTHSKICGGQGWLLSTVNPTYVLESYTTGFSAGVPVCGALPGAPERIFTIFPQSDGELTISTTSDFDLVLAVYASCPGGVLDGLLRCSDGPTPLGKESVSFGVAGMNGYYVVVSGYGPNSYGAFTLTTDFK
jgi:hypothetical protein